MHLICSDQNNSVMKLWVGMLCSMLIYIKIILNVLRLIDRVHSLTVPVLVPPVSSSNKQQVYLCVFVCVYVHVCKGQWEDSLGYTGPYNFRIIYILNKNRYIHICMYLCLYICVYTIFVLFRKLQ